MSDKEEKNKQLFDREDQEFMNMTIQELLRLKRQYEQDMQYYKKGIQIRDGRIYALEDFQDTHKKIIKDLKTKFEKAFYLLEKNKLVKLSRLLAKMMPQ